MAIKPFEIQSPSLVLAGVQMQAGTTGVVIPGVTQATTYSVDEVDDNGDQTVTWGSVPTVIDNGRYAILNGDPEPAGYTISEYTIEELDGDGYIDDIEVTVAGSFPASFESVVTQDMWATEVSDPFASFNPSDWTQIPFAPQVRAGEIENVGGGASLGNLEVSGTTIGIVEGASESSILVGNGPAGLTLGLNSEGPAYLNLYANTYDSQSYSEGSDYTTGTYTESVGGGTITLTGATVIETFLNNLSMPASITSIVINGTDTVPYDGAGYGGGTVNINTTTAPSVDPTSVTSILFNITYQNQFLIDEDEGDYGIYLGDLNFDIETKRDVNITAGDDFRLQATDILSFTNNGIYGDSGIQFTTDGLGNSFTWAFDSTGATIFPTLTVDLHNGGTQAARTLQFGDNSQQAVITGPTPSLDVAAQRLIIQGQRGNGTGEGGDVYIWGGDADTNGGDIKIYAGDADNVSAGSGGYVNIEGGSGFDGGGYVSIQGGQSGNSAGGPASVIGGFGNTVGGEANIRGGQGTVAGGGANITGGYGGGGPGGNVTIVGGGSANGLSEYGNINLTAGASSWVFGNDGNLTISGNIISSSDIGIYNVISTASGTQEGGSVGGPGAQTFTAQVSYFPTIGDIQVGWTVTGNNLTGTTTVTVVDEYAPGFFEITTDTSVTDPFWYGDTYTFTGSSSSGYIFNNDGILTLPGEGIIRSNNDTVILQSYDVANTTAYELRVGTTGGVYLQQGANTAWLSLFPNSGDAEITAGLGTSGGAGKNLSITAGSADQSDYYTTAGGNVNISGGLGATNDGGGGGPGGSVNITSGDSADPAGHPGNVTVSTGPYTWNFDYNGTLNLPDGTAYIGSGANVLNLHANDTEAIYISEISNGISIETDGNVTVLSNVTGATNYAWTFDNTGNLTLPGNTFTVNYANGTQVSLGGGSSNISNGTSNVNIASSGGNVTVSVGGTSNVIVATTTGANVTGTLTTTDKIGYLNGGSATQASSGSSVTVNQLTGIVTMAKNSWTAGDTEFMLLNCNKVANDDFVMVQCVGSTYSPAFNVTAYPYTVTPNTIAVWARALETLSDTVGPKIQFFIMKAPTS